MARFLSAAWFARLGELTEATEDGGPASDDGEAFVVEQVVERAPEGLVRYHLVLAGSRARVVEGPAPRAERPGGAAVSGPRGGAAVSGHGGPQLVLTSDYVTASAIARGELSAETALFEGRIRVRGDMDRLSKQAPELSGIDPVPPHLRAETTY